MALSFDSDLAARWQSDGERWTFEVPTEFGQGRAVYGGLIAAAAAALIERVAGEAWPVRAIQTAFLRPATPGSMSAQVTPLRQGKGTSFFEVELSQKDVVARVQVVVGKPRAGATEVPPPTSPTTVDPDDRPDLPYVAGMMPEFLQHFRMRWAEGGIPFSGSDEARLSGFCRYREPAGGVAGLLGLLDLWPCPTLAILSKPTPGTSVTWSAHILSVPESFDGWFHFEYETVAGAGGYHTAVGRLYGPDRRLCAFTEQLMMVFG